MRKGWWFLILPVAIMMKRRRVLLALALVAVLVRPVATGAIVPAPAPRIPVAIRMAMTYVPPWEVSPGDFPAGYYLVAHEVSRYFPRRDWVDMTAIGVAESCGHPGYVGDRKTPYPSVGLFQVRLVHSAYLARATGSMDRGVWIHWLKDPDNNARAAAAVFQGDGMDAWGAWTDGRAALFRRAAETVLARLGAGK